MESKHTKEPWFFDENETSYVFRAQGYHNGFENPQVGIVWDDFCGDVVAKANAQRIVQCVNACAGLNPEFIPLLVKETNDVYGVMLDLAASFQSYEDYSPEEIVSVLQPYITALRQALIRVKGE